MRTKIAELKEMAQELLDLGDSHEKREGYGMMRVLDELEPMISISKARDILCESDEITIEEQVERIRNEPCGGTLIDHIDGVIVWDKLEWSLTCDEFIEMIDQ